MSMKLDPTAVQEPDLNIFKIKAYIILSLPMLLFSGPALDMA